MKDQEYDELAFLKEENKENLNKSYKDNNFRFYFFLDFFTVELICLSFAIFMLGIRDFYGQSFLEQTFIKFWYVPVIFIGIALIELLLCFLFFRAIILWGKKWFIYILYFMFIFICASFACFASMASLDTTFFFQGTITLNTLAYMLMNSIRALEDKTIVKLLVMFFLTTLMMVLYTIFISRRSILFFILLMACVLYFSYCLHYYKRLLIVGFPKVFQNKNMEPKTLDDFEKDNKIINETNHTQSFVLENQMVNVANRIYVGEAGISDAKEKIILNKYAISELTKLCFLASFLDTIFFNFS